MLIVMNGLNQISPAIEFADCCEPESSEISRVAEEAHVSPRHFYRLFRAAVGLPFGEYLRQRRMIRAMTRLVDSDDSVLSIALDCGFDSHEGFSRAFAAIIGVPPASYHGRGRGIPPLVPRRMREEVARDLRVVTVSPMELLYCLRSGPNGCSEALGMISKWILRKRNKNEHPAVYLRSRYQPMKNTVVYDDSGKGHSIPISATREYECSIALPTSLDGAEGFQTRVEAGGRYVTATVYGMADMSLASERLLFEIVRQAKAKGLKPIRLGGKLRTYQVLFPSTSGRMILRRDVLVAVE